METELKVTSGKEWRKKRQAGVLVELPSGFNAMLRSVSVELLFAKGRIPEPLTAIAVEVLEGKQESSASIEEKVKLLNTATDLMRLVTKEMFISPRIVDHPKTDDEIHIDDVDMDDVYFCYQFLNRPLRDLEPFRPKQKQDVEPVGAESIAADKTLQNAEAVAVGAG